MLFGGSWVASIGDVVRSGDATQRKPAETSGNQPARNFGQRSKAIVTGIDSSRSAYYYKIYYYYYYYDYYYNYKYYCYYY